MCRLGSEAVGSLSALKGGRVIEMLSIRLAKVDRKGDAQYGDRLGSPDRLCLGLLIDELAAAYLAAEESEGVPARMWERRRGRTLHIRRRPRQDSIPHPGLNPTPPLSLLCRPSCSTSHLHDTK